MTNKITESEIGKKDIELLGKQAGYVNTPQSVETRQCLVSTKSPIDLYKNKYRIASTRLQYWDYGSNAAYFVTICTQNKTCFLGDITDGEMRLSEIGEIAEKYWHEIPDHFPFMKLDAFVVIPNHVHGILIIDNNINTVGTSNVETLHCNVSTTKRNVSTESDVKTGNEFYSKISPKPESLSTIIRSYKSIVTKTIKQTKIDVDFAWQSRFYDHIIRDEQSYERIAEYIKNNPLNWEQDDEYV